MAQYGLYRSRGGNTYMHFHGYFSSRSAAQKFIDMNMAGGSDIVILKVK